MQRRAAPKKVLPIHQQILGKAQIELDLVEDLRYKLDIALENDVIQPDMYEKCLEALDAREEKASAAMDKTMLRKAKPVEHEHKTGAIGNMFLQVMGWLVIIFCCLLYLGR